MLLGPQLGELPTQRLDLFVLLLALFPELIELLVQSLDIRLDHGKFGRVHGQFAVNVRFQSLYFLDKLIGTFQITRRPRAPMETFVDLLHFDIDVDVDDDVDDDVQCPVEIQRGYTRSINESVTTKYSRSFRTEWCPWSFELDE